MTASMKARDEARLSALRMIKSALKKHEIDSMKPLDEATEIQVMNTILKQRRDSIDMFRKGGRPELAEKEEAELKIVESFLPAAAIARGRSQPPSMPLSRKPGASSAKDMGKVMKAAQGRLAGKRVDGKALSDKVRARLG